MKASTLIISVLLLVNCATILSIVLSQPPPPPTSLDVGTRLLQSIPNHQKLEERLRSIDRVHNTRIALSYNPFFSKLVNEGHIFTNEKVFIDYGEAHECKRNTANYFFEHQTCVVCVGYILVDDYIWTAHSWILEQDKLLEVTFNETVTYYGVALSRGESINWFFLFGSLEMKE